MAYLALEPNPFFHPRLREEARKRGLALTLLPGRAEAIPLPGGSVDLVVATLVLCSVADPEKAIEEVHRVLRPGGAYLFLEHVAAPKRTPCASSRRWPHPSSPSSGTGATRTARPSP